MKAAVVSIGDELLIGQTVNTNAAWLGQELSKVGIPVTVSYTVSDVPSEITDALDVLKNKVQLIILTGGLGPTKDDLTKYTLAKYFDSELKIVPEVLERIEGFFKKRNSQMLDVNIQQAALPVKAQTLNNFHGTASGMWFENDGCIVISLPGVPYEMRGIMKDEVFPRLKARFEAQEMYHQTLMTQGIGESFLANQFEEWENRVRNSGLSLAYLPSPGNVKLRISSPNGESDKKRIHELFEEILTAIPQYAYSIGEMSLSEFVGVKLKALGKTVGSVESCTGGAIAKEIVKVAGSSAYFEGGIIAYSYQEKERLLGIDADKLTTFGAVSEEVIKDMATKGREKLDVDYCVATSGIAGPDGGTTTKPVGTVWIAIASKDKVLSKCFKFGEHRERNIQVTTLTALNLLRCFVEEIKVEKK
ncbi:MAG: nicotinamide-nucleotide amidase [Lentimonas sp.]|jgi:nicotinamide-nucleotide amidase